MEQLNRQQIPLKLEHVTRELEAIRYRELATKPDHEFQCNTYFKNFPKSLTVLLLFWKFHMLYFFLYKLFDSNPRYSCIIA